MKGVVFLGNRGCAVREFPVAEPGRDEALIRIMATGICGSDLHVYRSDEASDQIRGHEPCGVVERTGRDVKSLSPGDRVSVHHHLGCGVCAFCARGEFVACPNDRVVGVAAPGSFAEFTVAPERNCILLPDAVTFVDGAFMACVGTTAYAALRRLGVMAHQALAVFGLGPVGLSVVLVGKAMGLRVIGVDVVAERVALALRCGADEAVNARGADPVAAVRAFSRIPCIDPGQGVDYVIETSGSADARRNILPSLRRGGRAAIVGVGSDEPVIISARVELGLRAIPCGERHEFRAGRHASLSPGRRGGRVEDRGPGPMRQGPVRAPRALRPISMTFDRADGLCYSCRSGV